MRERCGPRAFRRQEKERGEEHAQHAAGSGRYDDPGEGRHPGSAARLKGASSADPSTRPSGVEPDERRHPPAAPIVAPMGKASLRVAIRTPAATVNPADADGREPPAGQLEEIGLPAAAG